MSTERDILAASCDSRDAFELIATHIGTGDLTDSGRMVWDAVQAYYTRDPDARRIDMDTLHQQVDSAVTNPKHKEALGAVVEGIARRDVSGINVASAMLAHKREVVGTQLATALAAGRDSAELLAQYNELLSVDALEQKSGADVVFGWDAASEEAMAQGELIKIAPMSLNERLAGGCMRGHHIILFARPEAGKTSFLANMAAGFLHQGLRVLYLGNEDPIEDVRMRFLGRVIEWPRDRIIADRAGAMEVASHTTNWHNFGSLQLEPGTPSEVEALVRDVEPDVLMIDQLRNIQVRTSKSDGMVQHLEAAAKAMRQVGIRNRCLVVSVTQAGATADNKAILDMSDVDSSKTGIPAQADVMIGLGFNHEDDAAGRRVISLPKNKRSGRHEFFPVGIDFTLGKFTSI